MYAQDGDLEHIFGDVAKILQHEIFQNHIWYFFYFTKKGRSVTNMNVFLLIGSWNKC